MPAPTSNSPLPPPTPARAASVTGVAVSVNGPVRLQNPWALFAAAVAIATAMALAIGFGIGFAVITSTASSCTPTDGWCELGAVLFGLAAGILAGVVTYIAAGVVTISRCRPKGRRSRHVIIHLAFPFGLYVGLALLQAIITGVA